MENSKAFRIDRYTELIIVVPPGEPVIKVTSPFFKTMLGVIEDNIRFFG